MSKSNLKFTGSVIDPDEPYIVTPDLVEAVNTALYLKRPLLLEGEPGAGKTGLAKAVAAELKMEYIRWDINSTSTVQDGLYIYDASARLLDAQLASIQTIEQARKPVDPHNYLVYGPIGMAYRMNCPSVVLINEIDNAGKHFPQDLLYVITDPRAFFVREVNVEVKAAHPILFIITNNQTTNNLSDSFIRKCIYHYIRFPPKEVLLEIVSARLNIGQLHPLLQKAVDRFMEIRQQSDLQHKPGIGEFLDWVRLMLEAEEDSLRSLVDKNIIPYPDAVFKLERSDQNHNYVGKEIQKILRQLMIDAFNLEELRSLCLDLDLDYESLGGEGKESKIREIIAYHKRRGRLVDLIMELKDCRPKLWDKLTQQKKTSNP